MLSIALKNVLFKIMNNSVYGKTTENLRKRVQVRLVDNVKEYKNDPVEKDGEIKDVRGRITESVGLKSKMHSLVTADHKKS